MWWSIVWATIVMVCAILHLLTFSLPEKLHSLQKHEDVPVPTESVKLNIKETIATINQIPGLFALIFFTTFNNFLWGVFMALMDPYWLLMVSVQTWGLMFGVFSLSLIAWWLYISKKWLWKNPLKTLFIVDIICWTTSIWFTIQPSIVLLCAGMFVRMFFSPFAEAAESTVLQKVVPYDKQGRVFGIAQSIESMAMPITTLFIGPITQLFFIPFMTDWLGAQTIWHRFGTGDGRGMALVFIIAWIIWLIVTLLAFRSKYYTILTTSYMKKQDV